MHNAPNLSLLHAKLLDIAIEFHKICEKNGIAYYMLGGTMLGAIRHKGFIPWDDDMDFGVMEDDILRLKNSLEKELPSCYRLRDINNTESISNMTLKIEDTRYEIEELEKENVKDKIGLNIDIFPLSRTNPKKCFFSRNGLAQFFIRLNWSRFLNYKKRGLCKYFVSLCVKFFLAPFPKSLLPRVVYDFIIPHKGHFITNYWGAWINKEIVPEEVMGNPKLYKFEKVSFFGVAEPHEYLGRLYGDYMKLPTKEEIHYHIVGLKKR